MILILHKHITHAEAVQLLERLQVMGFKAVKEQQGERIILAIVSGIDANTKPDDFIHLPQVEKIENFSESFKLAGHDLRDTPLIIQLGNVKIGGDELTVIGGPCSIENEEQIHRIAKA
ncbi:MAG: 3-deoxy-7-phosphoheptulonate synthase, partial [Gammaproteobacteria bacterium]|nr:3-deoxy-7-phosphoheptulonate synthase [Gammaproteobacteria bacterium]